MNEPFRPSERTLPRIYFSADWHWEPEAQKLKPRREDWGGLLLALAALMVYARGIRRDVLAWRMGLWGMLGGAIGFPLGQCVQAFHAWNLSLFQQGLLAQVDPIINWWNFMETTFGTVMGATLGLGLWLNRHRIALPGTVTVTLARPVEWTLIAVHIFLLLCAEFDLVPRLGWIYDPGLFLALIPLVAIAGGRVWPYWLMFPILIIPIAGKTLRNLGYENQVIPLDPGWMLYVILPIAVMAAMAIKFSGESRQRDAARPFLRSGLLLTTWVAFGLNFAFFRYPWPWQEWTFRTPNMLVFLVCALGLTSLWASSHAQERDGSEQAR